MCAIGLLPFREQRDSGWELDATRSTDRMQGDGVCAGSATSRASTDCGPIPRALVATAARRCSANVIAPSCCFVSVSALFHVLFAIIHNYSQDFVRYFVKHAGPPEELITLTNDVTVTIYVNIN
jgi:hypothetical protein